MVLSLLVAGAAAISGNTFAQEVPVAGAVIEFDKEVHDYGNVNHGGNGVCTFVFKNTGTAPLIISPGAKGSCGCTSFQLGQRAYRSRSSQVKSK